MKFNKHAMHEILKGIGRGASSPAVWLGLAPIPLHALYRDYRHEHEEHVEPDNARVLFVAIRRSNTVGELLREIENIFPRA